MIELNPASQPLDIRYFRLMSIHSFKWYKIHQFSNQLKQNSIDTAFVNRNKSLKSIWFSGQEPKTTHKVCIYLRVIYPKICVLFDDDVLINKGVFLLMNLIV